MRHNTFSKSDKAGATTFAAALTLCLATAQPAVAGFANGGWNRSSTVTATVADLGGGTWSYGYTVNNTSQFNEVGPDQRPILVDWELPWFGDAGITNIVSPTPNWNWSIQTIGVPEAATGWDGMAEWQTPGDPFYAGPTSPFTLATQVLHWYNLCAVAIRNTVVAPGGGNGTNAVIACAEGQFTDAIFPGDSLSGFGFDAGFGPTGAPYQASWAFMPVRTGDPDFPLTGGFPNSPSLRGNQAPEPGALGLLGMGLAALVFIRRRRT